MSLVVLNPKSNAHRSEKRWKTIASQVPHEKMLYLQDFTQNEIPTNPVIIAAGGDGCLHSVVNTLIEKKGLSYLNQISIGYIGLGSNNSYLQPLKEKTFIHGIPVQIRSPSFLRDLIEVEIRNGSQTLKKYIISNASLGLLSYANVTFNQNPWVQRLKGVNISLADILSFFITVKKFKPFRVSINSEELDVTNLHWLKAPYFTKDLYFPLKAALDSGSFDFYSLKAQTYSEILSRFSSMFLRQKMDAGFNKHQVLKSIQVKLAEPRPLEIDGEIYWGEDFSFKIHQAVLRTLS